MSKKLIILLHLLALIVLISPPPKNNPFIKTPLSIHLKHEATLKTMPAKKMSAPPSKKTATPQAPKKQTPKPPRPAPKKTTTKPQAISKELNKPTYEKKTLEKIEESVAKLEQLTQNEPTLAPSPSLAVAGSDEQSLETCSDVALYLFQQLELPEKGKVTLELSLTPDGKIEKVTILDSENDTNSIYLLDALKDLILPFQKKDQIPTNLKVCFTNLQV